MTVTLRPAKRDEVPAIVAMLADDGLGRGREAVSDPAIYYDAFDAMADDPNNRLLVAEQDGDLVGTLQITFIRGLSRKGASARRSRRCGSPPRIAARASAARFSSPPSRSRARKAARWCSSRPTRRAADAHRFYAQLGFVASHEGMKLALDP